MGPYGLGMDPFTLIASAVVGALAGKATEAATGAGRRLAERVRDRLRGRGAVEDAALSGALAEPGSVQRQSRLAEVIGQVWEEDPAFRAEIGELAERAGVTVVAQTANVVSAGAIQNSVQAGRDVHLHLADPRPARIDEIPLVHGRFVNRAAELRSITGGEPYADTDRIVVIEGPPGVGKRAVARRYAYLNKEAFPGGALYVDAADYRTGMATDIDAMLADKVEALSGGGAGPSGRAALRAAYRTRLRAQGGPILLVVENVTEPAQVVALLPHVPGSLVLVTAAPGADLTELDAVDAAYLRIGKLEEAHCLEFFRQVAGGDEGFTALIRRCDGLPMALMLMAKRAERLRRDMSPAELARQQAEDKDFIDRLARKGLEPMSATFSFMYERLDEPVRRAYRLLGLFPGTTVTPGTAAVVLGEGDARDMLDALVEDTVLELRAPRAYVFSNELLRQHARRKAEEEEPAERRQAVRDRLLRHYLLHVAFFDRAKGERSRIADHAALLAGHADPFAGEGPKQEGFAWCDAERANLVAIVQAAYDSGDFRTTMLLADGLMAYYPDRRDPGAWIAVCDLGAKAARRLEEPWAEAKLRGYASRPLAGRGDHDKARGELDRANELAEETGDPVLRASVAELQGRLAGDLGDHGHAIEYLTRALALNEEAGERRGAALVRTFLGDALLALGDHAGARESYAAALELYDDRDQRMAARTRTGIGAIHLALGELDAAAKLLNSAVQDLHGTHYEARARIHLAELAARIGAPEAERGHLLRAQEIYRDEGDPRADELAARLGLGSPGDELE